MIPNNVEKFPVLYYEEVSNQLNRLWDLIWANGGGSSWYRLGDRAYEAFPSWGCDNHKFFISSIKGGLPFKYEIKLEPIGLSIALKDRCYDFSFGRIYHANKYLDRWESETIDEFVDNPLAPLNGVDKECITMTSEIVAEAIAFVSDLCDRIEEANIIRYHSEY